MQRSVCNVLARVGRRTIVTEIRDEDHLAAIFKENSKVVIDFTADWCGPCQKIKKDYEKLSDAISDVSFVKVNVDDNPELASEYGAYSIPHFVGVASGKSVGTVVGAKIEAVEELANQVKSA